LNAPWSEETFRLVSAGIRIANDTRSETLPLEWIRNIEKRTMQLNKDIPRLEPGNLNIVLFHVKIPHDAPKVIAPDIRDLDHDNVDYETLIKFNIEIALKTNPKARIYLFTDHDFLRELSGHSRLAILRLDVCSAEPMFERVVTMCAYTKSQLFQQPSVLLDSDAFLLRPAQNIFANDFDIGLTHRNIHGQMPINEGVIFVNNKEIEKSRKFFETYLASYLAIEQSTEISKIYKNLRRWRGGQLSVNSAANGGQVYQTGLRGSYPADVAIAYLPCASYNLSEIKEMEIVSQLRQRTMVLHLKGLRKHWIHSITQLIGI
jgi:hypothetical protein